MPLTPVQLRELTLHHASALGFDIAGVARVAEFPELRHFAEWIAQGFAAEMHYLARRSSEADGTTLLRQDIRNVFPWARSVICCGLVYNTPYPRSVECEADDRGWISRYAWGADYHEVLENKLRQLADVLKTAVAESERSPQFTVYVDTGPLVERVYAHHAGLGWIAKNTCLIHERLGSWFFLGTLVCSADIAPDSPLPDRCGSCTRCIEACPTNALRPYVMDASRCLAYLNIELRGSVPEEFRPPMGHNVIGCDICQDVCPWNQRAPVTSLKAFEPRDGVFHPRLEQLAAMSEDHYRETFRRSAVKRAKYSGLMRNVAIAMGNSGDPKFRPALEKMSHSADPVIREHAEWALQRLNSPPERPY